MAETVASDAGAEEVVEQEWVACACGERFYGVTVHDALAKHEHHVEVMVLHEEYHCSVVAMSIYGGQERGDAWQPPRRVMPELTITTCGSCPAEVFWAETQHGKSMPVDAVPVDNGNLIIESYQGGKDGHTPIVRYVKKEDPDRPSLLAGEARYVSHFATCPDAQNWRR